MIAASNASNEPVTASAKASEAIFATTLSKKKKKKKAPFMKRKTSRNRLEARDIQFVTIRCEITNRRANRTLESSTSDPDVAEIFRRVYSATRRESVRRERRSNYISGAEWLGLGWTGGAILLVTRPNVRTDVGVRRAGIPTSQLQRQRSSRVERIKKWFSITTVLKR